MNRTREHFLHVDPRDLFNGNGPLLSMAQATGASSWCPGQSLPFPGSWGEQRVAALLGKHEPATRLKYTGGDIVIFAPIQPGPDETDYRPHVLVSVQHGEKTISMLDPTVIRMRRKTGQRKVILRGKVVPVHSLRRIGQPPVEEAHRRVVIANGAIRVTKTTPRGIR